jgi:hypothetical protein
MDSIEENIAVAIKLTIDFGFTGLLLLRFMEEQ